MSNRPSDERSTRSLMRTNSGTYLVSLPLELIMDLKWREKQKLTVTRTRGGILIKDWKK